VDNFHLKPVTHSYNNLWPTRGDSHSIQGTMRNHPSQKPRRGGLIFPKTLKTLRLEAGLSQNQLSYKIKVSTATISRWENNSFSRISRHSLKKLAKVFNISVEELQLDTKPNKKTKQLIPSKLRTTRLQTGLTQKELAEKTGISYPHISYLERNPFAHASQENLQEISKALEKPISKFWDNPYTNEDFSADEQTFIRAYKRFYKPNRLKLLEKLQEFEEENEGP